MSDGATAEQSGRAEAGVRNFLSVVRVAGSKPELWLARPTLPGAARQSRDYLTQAEAEAYVDGYEARDCEDEPIGAAETEATAEDPLFLAGRAAGVAAFARFFLLVVCITIPTCITAGILIGVFAE